MSDIHIDAGVIDGATSELIEYPNDRIFIRAAGHGEVQVVEYWSDDREGPPAHSHAWDEVELVIEGVVDFLVGETWTTGGPGTVQLLPKGVPHAVKVPDGMARIVMVTIGPPYDGFGREMAKLQALGAPLTEIVEAAARHGVKVG